jgi:hypothetical protein
MVVPLRQVEQPVPESGQKLAPDRNGGVQRQEGEPVCLQRGSKKRFQRLERSAQESVVYGAFQSTPKFAILPYYSRRLVKNWVLSRCKVLC